MTLPQLNLLRRFVRPKMRWFDIIPGKVLIAVLIIAKAREAKEKANGNA